jgi:hypothetical protein
MAEFIVEQGGKKYRIEAPDPKSAAAAFKKFQAGQNAAPEPAAKEPGTLTERAEVLANERGEVGLGGLARNQALFGFEDLGRGLVEGVKEMGRGGSFKEGLQVGRKAQDILEQRAREKHGKAALAAEIGGGVATIPLGLGIRGAATLARGVPWLAKGLKGTGSFFTGRTKTAPTRMRRAAHAGATGTAAGAAAGLGNAPISPDASRTQQVMEHLGAAGGGAIVGGLTGGATSLGIDAIGSGVRTAKNVFTGNTAPGRAMARLEQTPREQAARLINQRAAEDGMTPDQLIAKSFRRGDGSLLEAGGPNLQGLAKGAQQIPGEGKATFNKFLTRGRMKQAREIEDKMKAALGDPAQFNQRMTAINQSKKALGDSLYTGAFQSFKQDMSRGSPNYVYRGLMQLDNELARLQNTAAGRPLTDIKKFRSFLRRDVTGNLKNELEEAHQIKIALENEIAKYTGDDSLSNVGRAQAIQIKNKIVDILDKNPAYKVARETFADHSSLQRAGKLGQDFLNMSEDELADQLARMGTAEKTEFKVGVVKSISDMMRESPDTHDLAKKIFGSASKRAKLRQAFDSDTEFRKFQSAVTRMAHESQAYNRVLTNSATSANLNEMAPDRGIIQMFSQLGDVAITPERGTPRILAQYLARIGGLDPDTASEIAAIMTSKDQKIVSDILKDPGVLRSMRPGNPKYTPKGPTQAIASQAAARAMTPATLLQGQY